MRTPAEASGLLKPEHLEALKTVRAALAGTHRPPADVETLSAHDLCRSAEMVLRNYPPGLNVRHYRGGFFGFDHSWLFFPDDEVVLDVYPMLCGSGPLLVCVTHDSPWHNLYVGTPVPTFLEEIGG